MPNFLQTEHSKKQEALADYQAFIRTELEERQHLVEAIRTSGLDYKMAVLSVQEAVNDLNRQVKMLVDDFYKQRVFVDTPFPISANIPYEIDYRERKYVFMWSAQALSLTPQDGGPSISIAANQWNNISFRRGLKLFAPAISDSQYATVIVRCTDVPTYASEFVSSLVGAGNQVVPWFSAAAAGADGITGANEGAVVPWLFNGLTYDRWRSSQGVAEVATGGRSATPVAASVAADTVIKGFGPGRLVRVLVTVTGANPMSIFDNASGHTGTIVGQLPANPAVGSVFDFEMPVVNGITVQGSATNPGVTISFT